MIERPSPNCDARETTIDMLVLHYTGMDSAADALDRMCSPDSKVSTHYLIDETGKSYALVAEDHRAWHAGVASWHGDTDINAHSIGIELHNPGHEFGSPAYPEAQIGALIDLARDIITRHDIAAPRVLGHSDVAPQRKRDPGEHLDWRRLAGAGVGLWPDVPMLAEAEIVAGPGAEGAGVLALQSMFGAYGYEVPRSGVYDGETATVVAAFQRHFRPARVDGVADAETAGVLNSLLVRLADS